MERVEKAKRERETITRRIVKNVFAFFRVAEEEQLKRLKVSTQCKCKAHSTFLSLYSNSLHFYFIYPISFLSFCGHTNLTTTD